MPILVVVLFLFSCCAPAIAPDPASAPQTVAPAPPVTKQESPTKKTDDAEEEDPPPPCVPKCGTAKCGVDPVCGKSCGKCTQGEACGEDGQCFECTPDCDGRMCGPDPVCGFSCGACSNGLTCGSQGTCGNFCTVGATRCSADGQGFEACGPDKKNEETFGDRIPCLPGASCVSGSCRNNTCIEGEIVWLLDTSSSMKTNGSWTWVTNAVLSEAYERAAATRMGMMQFPGSFSCSPAAGTPIAPNNFQPIYSNFIQPSTASQTPIAETLQDARNMFGDPSDGQAAILITDGDETCATQAEAITAAGKLLRAGIRLYVFAVTNAANKPFLDKLAAAGGTQAAVVVTTEQGLRTAIANALSSLDLCACSGDSFCSDNTAVSCADDRRSRVRQACQNDCTLGACMPTGVKKIVQSEVLMCVLKTSGQARCADAIGAVTALPGNYRAIAIYEETVCAAMTSGGIDCFGSLVGAPTSGSFTHVAVGDGHACAVTSTGSVQCWGNYPSNLVVPAGPVHALAAGRKHMLALQGISSLCFGDTQSCASIGLPANQVSIAAYADGGCFSGTGGVSCFAIGGGSHMSTLPTGAVSASPTWVGTIDANRLSVWTRDCYEAYCEESVVGKYIDISVSDRAVCAIRNTNDMECPFMAPTFFPMSDF